MRILRYVIAHKMLVTSSVLVYSAVGGVSAGFVSWSSSLQTGQTGHGTAIAAGVPGHSTATAMAEATGKDTPQLTAKDNTKATPSAPTPTSAPSPAPTPSPTPLPDTSHIKAFLTKFTPGTLNEAIPHGVPNGNDSKTGSTVKRIDPPTTDMTYLNIRGAVYVDETNVHPANTRVAIADCQAWGLIRASNTWEKYIDLSLGNVDGRGWAEDFSAPGPQSVTDIRTEADGTRSVVTFDGYNFHYYNKIGKAPLVYAGSEYGDYVTACSARLVLANPAGPDDRASAHYIINTGNDWKRADGSCTQNSSGSTLCYAIGTGAFIKVTSAWRRVVFSTLDASGINNKPLPPEAAFLNPDGSFGN